MQNNPPSREWLAIGGALSIATGILAMVVPAMFSYILTAFIGALCLVSGGIGLFQAAFGKDSAHRALSAMSAALRFAAGAALFFFTDSGMLTITLILAATFVVEGVFCILTAFRMRGNPAWFWLLLNGIVAAILGWMVFAKWPADSEWVIGVLYGIQAIFGGASMLLLAAAGKPKAESPAQA
jgi:uncharacterized membrane protein HdeD (DUF308 family)